MFVAGAVGVPPLEAGWHGSFPTGRGIFAELENFACTVRLVLALHALAALLLPGTALLAALITPDAGANVRLVLALHAAVS